MPELSLQGLSQQLREAENPSPAHIELIQAIEALHQATLPFRQFRGRRKLPTVSARNKTQLAERLKAANTEEAKRSSTYQGARDAVVTQEDLARLKQLSVRMKNAAQTYLNGKLVNGQVPADASDYTKQRIQAARLILDYGAQGEEIRPEEIRKAEANEAEANRQIARRKDIQADEIPKTPEIPGIPRQGVGMG